MDNKITHSGKILYIDKALIKVLIIQNSACMDCHAKAACNISETKEKVIEIPNIYPFLKVGEEVNVESSLSLGLQAVVYAFIIPLLLLFIHAILWVGKWSDASVAFTCVALLAIYYGIIYCLRDKLKKKFIFTLKKI